LPQIVETSVEYRDFYRRRLTENGDHVILDNGAFELGESVALDRLSLALQTVRPTEVVLPDKRFGTADETVAMAAEAIDYFERQQKLALPAGYQPFYVAVPHGETF